MHDTDGADAVAGVGPQALGDQVGLHTTTPAFNAGQADELGLQLQPQRQFVPQAGKVPGFIHQHMVTRAQGVDQCRLPRTGAGGGINNHRMAGLKNHLHVGEHLAPQHAELGPTVVDGGQTDGAQHPVGHRTGTRNLQEVTPCGVLIQRKHGGSNREWVDDK